MDDYFICPECGELHPVWEYDLDHLFWCGTEAEIECARCGEMFIVNKPKESEEDNAKN